MSRKDFVPDSAKNFHDWCVKYHENASPQLSGVTGWDAARIATLKGQLLPMRDAAQAVLDAQQALDDAMGALSKSKKDHLPTVRSESSNIKTSPGYDDGVGDVLGITSGGGSFDANTYKPVGTAESLPGHVRLSTKKLGVDSVNIYMRLKGQGTLKLIVAKRVSFPFDDDTPPAVPGQAEQREYQFRGVIGDNEIGLPSDIVSVTFGG